MIFIRKEIMDGISIISNNSKSEDRIWLKLSAKFFGFDKDVFKFICSLYISPQGETSHITSRNDIWGLLQDEIIRYLNEGFIIMTGDFNARIGQEMDYVHHDSTDYVPLFINYSADYPLSRRSEDMVVNSYGKELLNLCISSHLRIVKGIESRYKA